MRILSWNCRGLGNLLAVRAFGRLIHSEAPDIVFAMETKLYESEALRHRGLGGLQNIFPVQCAGQGHTRAGGLFLLWSQNVDVAIISFSLNHILFTVTHLEEQKVMQVMGVYGYPDDRRKMETWYLVKRCLSDVSIPSLCVGDFNDCLSPRDKLGGDPPNLNHIQRAARIRAECCLQEVNFTGYRFTWSNNRESPGTIEERLDYALVNDAWDETWPITVVHHLSKHKSDHNPILLTCGARRKRKELGRARLFRFEEIWLQEDEECAEIVTETWCRLQNDLPTKIAEREEQTAEILQKTRETEHQLDGLLEQEEKWWKQRSRATWLRDGDKNTRFFHQKATQRRKRNMIEKIEDDRGKEYIEDRDIARVLIDYFVQLFATSHPVGIEDVTSLVANRLTGAHLQILEDPFTKEEVTKALFQMHPTKAPGIDGFPALFYQRFWSVIGDDVAEFCLQILHGHVSPGIINHTVLVLIPKVKKSVHANQFRPISLCNVIFKIVTKTIANIMKIILPDLICESQSAFVPGRLITDNALIAYECFHYMKKRINGRNGTMALKLDMSKAYDRIEWSFLSSVLSSMGFPQNWVDLIMHCVSTVSFSIMLNGNPQPRFVPNRGLRQGDPLSPYLFILCGEVFSALINRAVVSQNLTGIKVARSAPVISHLLFADDSVLFGRADMREAECLKEILTTYERVSGQVVNLDKSMLSVSRNVQQTRFDELKQLLGVKVVESFDRYLGLPTLIDINNMISNFFWGGDASRKGLHWTKWANLCRSKRDGGLGFRYFKAFNLALVAKNWWRIYSKPNALVARLFKAVYFHRGDLWSAKKGYRPSYTWSSIQKTRWVFEKGGLWRIGNGTLVHIWEDNWIPSGAPLIYRQDLASAQGQGGDFLSWPSTMNGHYSTKTGYNLIQQLLESDTASSSFSSSLPPSLWRKFWSSPALPRCKELCWRMIKGYLPVAAELRRRHLDVDATCGFCASVSEDARHVFLACPAATSFWFASPLSLRVERFASVADFWREILEEGDDEVLLLSQTLAYAFWEARNNNRFNGRNLFPTDTVQRALSTAGVLTTIKPHEPATSPASYMGTACTRRGGYGMVARDYVGAIMAAATAYPVASISLLLAEAGCLRWALRLAIDLGFRRVVFETDCLQLFNWWKSRQEGVSFLATVVSECRSLVTAFDAFSISFVKHSGNTVADLLARNASTYTNEVWVEEVPDIAVNLVAQDVLASMPPEI
ncbi:uncharacterized protein LOC130721892 [Lotus japonicus]|uniref:uncharacterized protein LOC130721892 n=1 Tax=Lotus japonicus TaxID=34305 RepID=UPI0025905E7F|nr:uncharacterized protein LOC130721892 [Lotus japonicus]